MPPPSGRIVGRFQGRAAEFGFAPPPGALRLKILKTKLGWTVFIQLMTDLPTGALVEWLPPTGLLRIEFGSRRVIRADFQRLPVAWERAFRGVELELATLDPDGQATATVRGPRSAVAAFARRLHSADTPPDLMDLHPSRPAEGFLTGAQDAALRAAVAAGYYRIPRALNLDRLASKLGISSASLSERLRRAEGRIISRYVDAGGKTPWDEATLFDEVGADRPPLEWPEPPPQPVPERRGPLTWDARRVFPPTTRRRTPCESRT